MATATYTPIATQTLGSAAASITFSSIPGTYTDLWLVFTGTTATAGGGMSLLFNGDTGTNYSITALYGTGASAASGNTTSTPQLNCSKFSAITTTPPATLGIDIFSYAGATNKTALITQANDQNGAGDVELVVGLWRSTAAITSITIRDASLQNLATGTIATLWGI